MNDSLRVINSFWYGSELTEIGELCINSFLKNGFEFKLWTYDLNLKVPKGCELMDASKILKKELLFRHKEESWVPFSIWFRFKLLYERGGAWTDMDIICLKPFKLKVNTVCGDTIDNISCNFISLSKGHLMALEMDTIWRYPTVKRYYDNDERKSIKRRLKSHKANHQREMVPWKFNGNKVLNLIKDNWTFNKIDSEKIYPVSYKNYKQIFDGTLSLKDVENANCIHLWNEIIRRENYISSSEKSLFNDLKEKYLKN